MTITPWGREKWYNVRMKSTYPLIVNRIKSRNQRGTIFLAKEESSGKRISCITRKTNIEEGQKILVTGEWKKHEKFGDQLHVSRIENQPTEKNVLESLSKSDIWPAFSIEIKRKIRGYAQERDMSEEEVMDSAIHITRAIRDRKKAMSLSATWRSFREHLPMLRLLGNSEIHLEKALQISKDMGPSGMDQILTNPFNILVSRNASYQDAVSVHAGLNKTIDHFNSIQPLYVRAMKEEKLKGNSGNLLSRISQKIARESGLAPEAILPRISQSGMRIRDEEYAVIRSLFSKEMQIAKRLATLYSRETQAGATHQVESDFLSDEQKEAVGKALNEGLLLVTGGPGTGKTTTIKEMIAHLLKIGMESEIITVSGKAADRASEASGQKAHTVHSFLNITPASNRSTKKLSNKAIIIDEASMIDTNLFYQVLESIDDSCKLILVGDVNQLESIEPGNILGDIAESLPESVVYLSRVRRFDQDSNINKFANAVLQRSITYERGNGLYSYIAKTDEAQYETNRKILDSYIKKHGNVDGIQVISPTWRGVNGVNAMNQLVQDMIPRQDERMLLLKHMKLYENDKVLARSEIPGTDIATGQLLRVRKIDFDEHSITLESNGTEHSIKIDDAGSLSLGFCITGHASQGSEFPSVLFSVTPNSERFADWKMLYTIATRAKENLIITTPPESLEKIIRNKANKRQTFLRECLDVMSTRRPQRELPADEPHQQPLGGGMAP